MRMYEKKYDDNTGYRNVRKSSVYISKTDVRGAVCEFFSNQILIILFVKNGKFNCFRFCFIIERFCYLSCTSIMQRTVEVTPQSVKYSI